MKTVILKWQTSKKQKLDNVHFLSNEYCIANLVFLFQIWQKWAKKTEETSTDER